jgi:hypothetical protein
MPGSEAKMNIDYKAVFLERALALNKPTPGIPYDESYNRRKARGLIGDIALAAKKGLI